MKTLRCKWFPPKGYAAITLFWWIIVRKEIKITQKLLNHEEIHGKQQLEMLYIPFFLWYATEFVIRWIHCGKRNEVYRNISFEREAKDNERDPEYIHNRRIFEWVHYIRR